jgi:hypothetical protein
MAFWATRLKGWRSGNSSTYLKKKKKAGGFDHHEMEEKQKEHGNGTEMEKVEWLRKTIDRRTAHGWDKRTWRGGVLSRLSTAGLKDI